MYYTYIEHCMILRLSVHQQGGHAYDERGKPPAWGAVRHIHHRTTIEQHNSLGRTVCMIPIQTHILNPASVFQSSGDVRPRRNRGVLFAYLNDPIGTLDNNIFASYITL